MKKTVLSVLSACLVMGAASGVSAAANPFSDVPADHWAYDAVAALVADGVIEGYGDGNYRGQQNITRYEMAQMVAKAMASSKGSAADKALVDKLAAEFSVELNNLGVRVANLERNADVVKWSGEARYTYTSQRTEGKTGKSAASKTKKTASAKASKSTAAKSSAKTSAAKTAKTGAGKTAKTAAKTKK